MVPAPARRPGFRAGFSRSIPRHSADRLRRSNYRPGMDPDDHVCLCFHVSLRKIANFVAREKPVVPSQISDCLGAGTGCQWCVPFLKKLHALHAAGEPMDLPVSPEEYAARRQRYRSERRRGGEDAGPEAPGDLTQRPPA